MCPIRLHLQNTNSKLKFNNQNHSRKSLKTQMWGPSEHRALGTCTAGWPVRQPSHLETLDQSRGPPASTTILALSAWPNPCSASRRVGIASLGFSLYKAGTVSHTCESPESGQALARVSQAAIMSAVFNWLPHKRVPACPVSLIPWWADTLSFLDLPTWARPGVSLRTPRQTSLYASWMRSFSLCLPEKGRLGLI